ncbi:MAG: hypothetical protein C0514_06115 [Candidatus Puniceispirillum sp.]|nr:hypothetical protein [Candidatus Puniceispirillum sp.]
MERHAFMRKRYLALCLMGVCLLSGAYGSDGSERDVDHAQARAAAASAAATPQDLQDKIMSCERAVAEGLAILEEEQNKYTALTGQPWYAKILPTSGWQIEASHLLVEDAQKSLIFRTTALERARAERAARFGDTGASQDH